MFFLSVNPEKEEMTKTAEKVGFIFATFALLSGEIQALTLTLDTVSALARGLKMLRPFVACPSSLEAGSNLRILTEGLEGRTAMATSSDVSSLMRLGSSRLLEGQARKILLQDFFVFATISKSSSGSDCVP